MLVTQPAEADTFYAALVRRDREYLGVFVVGVKTTGIVCLPTCRARKPLRKNVEFFRDLPTALNHGYRPCKLCRPAEPADSAPPYVTQALALVRATPLEKVRDQDLRAAGIAPERVRRWFKRHHGMTFQAYQRMLRINGAYQSLQAGASVTETAFATGYESLSGFAYTFKQVTGRNPQDPAGDPILIARFTTPLGPMFAAANATGLCLLEFADRRMLETELGDLQKRLRAPILVGENAHHAQVQEELAEYFAGTRRTFDVPLVLPGSDFQRLVWRGLQDIPYGATRSYQEQAAHIDRPKAVRAVGTANGHNRVAIIIPCHRVIGKDGKLCGYGGGLPRKRWLLDHERKHA